MFTINNVIWNIKIVPQDSEILVKPNGIRTLGVTDRDSHIIFITERLSTSLFLRVIRHEITHAIVFSYEYQMSKFDEEMLCNFIAEHIEEINDITEYLMP